MRANFRCLLSPLDIDFSISRQTYVCRLTGVAAGLASHQEPTRHELSEKSRSSDSREFSLTSGSILGAKLVTEIERGALFNGTQS